VRASISAIVFDPERPATLYAISGPSPRAELWKSYNGGASWSLLRTGLDPTLQFGWGLRGAVFDPADSRRLWVWSEYHVWFSADGGLQWTLRHGLSGAGPRFGQLLADPQVAERLVAISGESDLIASADGGASWTLLGRLPQPVLAAKLHAVAADPEVLYISGDRGLFRSLDGGRSWSLRSTFEGGGFLDLAIAPSQPAILFAVPNAAPDQLLRSTDAGATWQTTALPAPRLYCINPLVDPVDGLRVRVVVQRSDGYFLVASEDGGDTWGDEALPVPGPFVAAHPRDATLLYSGPDLHRSDDGGRSWRPQGSDIQGDGVSSLAAAAWDGRRSLYATVYGGNIGSRLLRSRNDGSTWRELPSPGLVRVAIDPRRAGRLFGIGGGVFRSDDHGGSWLDVTPPGLFGPISIYVDSSRAGRLFVGTMFAGIWRSEDAGQTWRQSVSGFPVQEDCTRFSCPSVGSFAIDAQAPDRIFVVVDGGLYRSDDRGARWRFAGEGLPGTGAVVTHPRLRGVVYAWTVDGVFESRDGGGRWRLFAVPVGTGLLSLLYDASTDHLYVATRTGVFRRLANLVLPPSYPWEEVGLRLPPFDLPLQELTTDPASPARLYGVLPFAGVWSARFAGVLPLHLPTGRFELRAVFASGGRFARGEPLRLSPESGAFSTADCGAPDLLVKLLDGGHTFWLFAGGLTRSEVELTVVDRLSGVARNYLAPPPRPLALADLTSFPAAPFARPAPAATAKATAGPASAGCALPQVAIGQRFCAAVRWLDAGEWRSGEGGEVPTACGGRRSLSAAFWFDRPSNPEVAVKLVPRPGGLEIFYAALTSRAWELEVSDRATGERRVYAGSGRPSSGADPRLLPPG
jgi:photosystem II stability/assembly factor-like uncharacterized protein